MSQLERGLELDTGGVAPDEVPLLPVGMGHTGHGDGATTSSGDSPSVDREKWVPRSNFWESQIVLAGHRPANRPRKRPLPRPRRFREPSRWRGALVLAMLLLVIGVFGIGLVEMSKHGNAWTLPALLPTSVPNHTVAPALTPTHTTLP